MHRSGAVAATEEIFPFSVRRLEEPSAISSACLHGHAPRIFEGRSASGHPFHSRCRCSAALAPSAIRIVRAPLSGSDMRSIARAGTRGRFGSSRPWHAVPAAPLVIRPSPVRHAGSAQILTRHGQPVRCMPGRKCCRNVPASSEASYRDAGVTGRELRRNAPRVHARHRSRMCQNSTQGARRSGSASRSQLPRSNASRC